MVVMETEFRARVRWWLGFTPESLEEGGVGFLLVEVVGERGMPGKREGEETARQIDQEREGERK